MPTINRGKGGSSRLYTKGELNAIADATVEPLARLHPTFLVIDEIAHLAIEQNPQESAVKFTKYTLPKIVKMVLEELNKT